MYRTTKTLSAALSILAGATTAQATLVAYDPFLTGSDRAAGQYDPGVDMRTMGAAALGWVGTQSIDGFGVSHVGSTGNFQGNALGENSAVVSYEQEGRMQWIGVGNFPFNRNITRQLNPTGDSSEWWMSIMVNRLTWLGVPSANTYIVGGFTNVAGNGIQIGYDDSAHDDVPDLVLRSNGISTVLTADSLPNDNQLIIVQLLVNQSGNDTMNVWVDPQALSANTPASLSITDQDLTSSLAPFTQSAYSSPGQSGVVFFDEIRLATSFESLTGIVSFDPADLDQDGDVDDADFGIAFAAFTGPGGVSTSPADLDNDGDVDDADFGIAFAAFTGPGGGAVVPEPTGLAMLGLYGLLVARRRRN